MDHSRSHLELRMEQYSQILFTYYRDAERAEARNDRYGSFIDLVAGSGLLHGQVILGQDVFCLSSANAEGSEMQQCSQAALLIPQGLGVIHMDADTFCTLRQDPRELVSQATSYFLPLSNCRPVLLQWLLPQIDGLVQQLLDLIHNRFRESSRMPLPLVMSKHCQHHCEARS